MTAMMMALGPYRFSLETATFDTYKRQTGYRWPEVELIGRDPVLQFTGPKLDTLTLNGVIYPHFAGGLGQVDAMRAEAAKGEPLLLTDGLGRVHQYWVILSIQEEWSVMFAGGVPRKIAFTLSLKRYGAASRAQPPAATPFFT